LLFFPAQVRVNQACIVPVAHTFPLQGRIFKLELGWAIFVWRNSFNMALPWSGKSESQHVEHAISRGVWGHAPQENFEIWML